MLEPHPGAVHVFLSLVDADADDYLVEQGQGPADDGVVAGGEWVEAAYEYSYFHCWMVF